MRQKATSSVLFAASLLFSAVTVMAGNIPQRHTNTGFPFKQRKVGSLPSPMQLAGKFNAFKFAAPNRQAADGVMLYGDVIYADGWTTSTSAYGVYSFPATGNTTLTSVYEDDNFNCNAGAVYDNGLYHILKAYGSDSEFQYINYYQYDTDSWSENDENEFSNPQFVASDLTVDPLTNTVYGAFSDGANGMQLATFNFTSSGYSVKGALSKHMLAIAADAEGTLFGIASDGVLYKVDKETAALTKIGSTGITPAAYIQSATFDWLSGKLYWATTLTTDIAGLYEVDTTTGKATLVSYFPNNEQIVGLYCTNKLSADEAPAAVADLTAVFMGTSTTGTVSFTMPTATNGGDELSGQLGYTVKVNDSTVTTGSADAGAEVSLPNVSVSGGNTKIVVYASNAAGKGLPAMVTVWTGYDVPLAPTDAAVAYADGVATITWSAPAGGVHGGYVDGGNIEYTVTRMPDNVVVANGTKATECTDAFKPEQLAAYYYVITATANGQTSSEAKTNTYVAGDAIVPPYSQPFDDATTFDLMTIIDANEDGSTWNMSAENGYAEIAYADEGGDDWLVTPQIKLTADRMWKFSCRINTPWAPNWQEKVGVFFGKAATADALTGVIMDDVTYKDTDLHLVERYFKVTEDGNYNVGIHAGSYELYQIQVDSILVEAGPLYAAPAAVADFKATADATGKLSATVSFTAPDATVDGKQLSSLTKIELYRNGELIKTFGAPAVGEAISFTDANAAEGVNAYKAIAYNASGFGYDASASVFVGEDVPSAPTDVKIVDNDGKGTLTWTAPTIGVNGGFVDTDNLVYGIKDNDGNTLAATAKGTSFTTTIDETGEQGYVMYAVFAGNAKGYSAAGISNFAIKGAPYTLPYTESFDNGEHNTFWGAVVPDDSYASWGVTYEDGVGGKSGYASFSGGQPGNEARFFSGKIDLSEAVNPVLEFYYWYRAEEGNQPLNVEVISEGKDTTVVKQLEYTLYMYSKDFELVRVPLSQFKGKKFIQIAFDCTSGDDYTIAAIDEVTVRDYFDNDLAVTVSAPSAAKSADEIEIAANVKNIGGKAASDYTVSLYEDDKLVDSASGETIAADSATTYTFKQTVGTLKESLSYKVVVDYAADGNLDNNTSDAATVSVTLPVYPAPTDLSAADNGNTVNLAWTEPDYHSFTVPTVDGAEDYEAFAEGTIGEWTTVDLDGLDTRSDIDVDFSYVEFPQQGKKMSFIVMNPEQAGAPFTNWMDEPTGWQPASGKQYFASFGSADGANDDWLISPELTGDAQTVSFSIHGYYGDEYEVLYSTTDKDPDSFTSISKQSAAVTTWTRAEYDLPEGAKYFAIRNTSYDYPYYIFVDDIRFEAAKDKGALSLTGYNVYRDGKKLIAEPIASPAFSESKPAAGTHLYQVTAVYTIGESSAATCEVGITSGIVSAGKDGIKVMATYGVDGIRTDRAAKRLRIEKMSDGTTRKVVVK